MADTIVTNTPATNDSGAAGWVVALFIILAVIFGGFFLYQRGTFSAVTPAPASSTNINVTVPTPTPSAPVPAKP